MNVLMMRFPSILTALDRARADRERFRRLVNAPHSNIRVSIRSKRPGADLHLGHAGRMVRASAIVFSVMTMGFVGLPEFEVQQARHKTDQIVIAMEDIPETRQIRRPPPPPRPAVPIATESELVPDDVTIETTDLDFDHLDLALPPPPAASTEEAVVEEEPLEFWAVEEKPRIKTQVPPEYPAVARKAGLQDVVLVRVLIGTDGRVHQAQILRGREIFHDSALKAITQYVFEPAYQNDKPVPVWMAVPIRYRLVG